MIDNSGRNVDDFLGKSKRCVRLFQKTRQNAPDALASRQLEREGRFIFEGSKKERK